MDYGTIKIPREEFERHNERRKSLSLSWVEYLDGQAPETPGAVDHAALAAAVADEVEARLR